LLEGKDNKELKVKFQEISEAGTQYVITDLAWVPDDLLSSKMNAEAVLLLTKKSDNRIELSGELKTEVILTCDFCLETFSLPVDASMQFILDCTGDDHWHVHQLECKEADLDIVTLEEPVVDLGDILREQLYLSLPLRKICCNGCQGLCTVCGTNLNKTSCHCSTSVKSFPFAVLDRLKKV
jgi:uncharacterized protein